MTYLHVMQVTNHFILILTIGCLVLIGRANAQEASLALPLSGEVALSISQAEVIDAPVWVKKLVHKLKNSKASSAFSLKEHPRLVAIALTVLLGPFGAHRIYLGTREIVPVFYTLTLGGGVGIVPFVDLLHLIFTKDLSRFVNNPNVLMW